MAIEWFRFEAQKWLSDPVRRALSPGARGALIDLLAMSWVIGPLPADLRQVARQLRIRMDVVEVLLEAGFFPRGEDGNRRDSRLEEDRRRSEAISAKRSKAGAKGGRNRGKNLGNSTRSVRSGKKSAAKDQQMLSGNQRTPPAYAPMSASYPQHVFSRTDELRPSPHAARVSLDPSAAEGGGANDVGLPKGLPQEWVMWKQALAPQSDLSGAKQWDDTAAIE